MSMFCQFGSTKIQPPPGPQHYSFSTLLQKQKHSHSVFMSYQWLHFGSLAKRISEMKIKRKERKILYESSVIILYKSTSLPKYDQNCYINTQELELKKRMGYYVRIQLVIIWQENHIHLRVHQKMKRVSVFVCLSNGTLA